MIVVDSSVWISYFHRTATPAVERLRAITRTDDILVGDVMMLEILQGARSEEVARALETELRTFTIVSMLSDAVAVSAARYYRLLRAEGITVRKTPDLIIAAYCIDHGHAVLHQDRDFDHFERRLGLKIVH